MLAVVTSASVYVLQSMHWMMNKKEEPMLQNVKSEDEATPQQRTRTGQALCRI